MSNENPEWARKLHHNLVRALGGLTTLGLDPIDPNKEASEARLGRAVKAICEKSADQVAAWLREIAPAQYGSGHKPTPRELLEGAVCLRWNCSPTSLRKIVAGPTARSRRRANRQQNPRFFEDLREFGSARFGRDGAVIAGSLGKGPDPIIYFDSVTPGSDVSAVV